MKKEAECMVETFMEVINGCTAPFEVCSSTDSMDGGTKKHYVMN
jgi:hypothetical protein